MLTPTRRTGRKRQLLLSGMLCACSLSARADLIKPVEAIGSAGVVRLGTYLEDNVAYPILLSTPFSFYGTNYSGLTVSVNGTLTYGNTNYFSSNPTNLGMPRGSTPGLWVCNDDWIQPDSGATPRGYIYYKQYSDGLAVTWVNLRHAPVTLGTFTNTFQAFLYNNGDIAFGYDQMNRVDLYVVGINKGSGSQYSSLTGVNTGTTAFAETGVPSVNLQTYLFRYDSVAGTYSPSIARALSGTITLESLSATAPAQTVTLLFHPIDSSGDFVRTVSVNSTGTFALPVVPAKMFTVRIKGNKWLAKSKTLDLTGGNVSGWNATLLGGDSNNDNAVDVTDLLAVISHYNQTQTNNPLGYLEGADFNGDGANDVADLLLVINNYNKIGE